MMNLCVIVAAYSLRCLHIIACAVLYVFVWSWFLWCEMYLCVIVVAYSEMYFCVIVVAYSILCLPNTVCHNVFGISSEPVGGVSSYEQFLFNVWQVSGDSFLFIMDSWCLHV